MTIEVVHYGGKCLDICHDVSELASQINLLKKNPSLIKKNVGKLYGHSLGYHWLLFYFATKYARDYTVAISSAMHRARCIRSKTMMGELAQTYFQCVLFDRHRLCTQVANAQRPNCECLLVKWAPSNCDAFKLHRGKCIHCWLSAIHRSQ